MKKFFSILVVAAVTLVVIPSCSTSDSLDEVIANELNVAAETDDQELPIAKSDNDQARC